MAFIFQKTSDPVLEVVLGWFDEVISAAPAESNIPHKLWWCKLCGWKLQKVRGEQFYLPDIYISYTDLQGVFLLGTARQFILSEIPHAVNIFGRCR